MSMMAPTLPASQQAQIPQGETRIAVRGVPWRTYELWVDSLPPRSGVRMAYDGEDLEIMTKGRQHENYGALIGRLVNEITVELGIPFSSNRETTWKRPEVSRGLEADQSYYFRPEKLAAAAAAKSRGSNDVADYPNPDLAIEIDISPSLIDRSAIYAALGVTEVWRFDGELLTIERLNSHGSYSSIESSAWLPIRPDEVVRWLTQEDSTDETAWTRSLRKWIRAELTKRPLGA
jgi:Uma2 family endonuclease